MDVGKMLTSMFINVIGGLLILFVAQSLGEVTPKDVILLLVGITICYGAGWVHGDDG